MDIHIKNEFGNLTPYLTPYKKGSSKWIKDVNIRAKIYKILGRQHRATVSQHWNGQLFLGYDTKNTNNKRK